MSTLQDNLDKILKEKKEKILAENIKKDIKIFDITGTLEVGMTPYEEELCNETALQILGEITELLHPIYAVGCADNSTFKVNDNLTIALDNIDYKTFNSSNITNVLFSNYTLTDDGTKEAKNYTLTEMLDICPYVTLYAEPNNTATSITGTTFKAVFSKYKPHISTYTDENYGDTFTFIQLAGDNLGLLDNDEIYTFSGTFCSFNQNKSGAIINLVADGYNSASDGTGDIAKGTLTEFNTVSILTLDESQYTTKSLIILGNYMI